MRVALVEAEDFEEGGIGWAPEGPTEHHSFAGFALVAGKALNPRSVYLAPGATHVLRALVPVKTPGVYQLIFEYDPLGKEYEDAKRELEDLPGILTGWDLGFVIIPCPPERTPKNN